jgi:hypothetical protein
VTTPRLETNALDESGSMDLAVLEGAELAASREEAVEDVDPNGRPVDYSGTDFDVEGLVRRLGRGDIVVPNFGANDFDLETAGFQRSFVWRRPQMDRFIESLLMGYPIPGIMLVQQLDRRYLVLDGQQRLRTLKFFYDGIHEGVEFKLKNVAQQYKDLTYKTLPVDLRRTLDNTFFQATIVKTDGTGESLEAVYQIFERLNAGGTQLTPHEIRVALYAGRFIDFLTKLNGLESWRGLYGARSPRLRDQEVVLRFVALYTSPGDYKRPLKKYLNDFVSRHRNLDNLDPQLIEARFDRAAALLGTAVGRRALRAGGGAINSALTEALMVGLARRLDVGDEPSIEGVAAAVSSVMEDPATPPAVSRATADEESVRTRLGIATRAFLTAS